MRDDDPPPQPFDRYTDPSELFDVCDASGVPTGRTKRRADVHRDGDWHRAFHCWVLTTSSDVPTLILQRRGAHKDTAPLMLDVTVGGHYGAGESIVDVVREVDEEIGRAVSLDDLTFLGRRIAVSDAQPGVIEREIQEVYLWQTDLPLEAFRPQPIEVASLDSVAVTDLLALLSGASIQAPTRSLGTDGQITPRTMTADELVPTEDRYFYRAAIVADLASRGYPHLAI